MRLAELRGPRLPVGGFGARVELFAGYQALRGGAHDCSFLNRRGQCARRRLEVRTVHRASLGQAEYVGDEDFGDPRLVPAALDALARGFARDEKEGMA